MFQKLRRYQVQILLFFLSVIGFALIRNYESVFFYDPLLAFFKGEYFNSPLPLIIEWKLYLGFFWRYFLNSVLSIFVIYVLFKNKEYVKLATFLYLLFFVVLMVLFIFVLHYFSDQVMALFYIRRFIIQPLFLLLFIPGFYFQQQDLKKQNT
jgi:exosortase F-associated protein